MLGLQDLCHGEQLALHQQSLVPLERAFTTDALSTLLLDDTLALSMLAAYLERIQAIALRGPLEVHVGATFQFSLRPTDSTSVLQGSEHRLESKLVALHGDDALAVAQTFLVVHVQLEAHQDLLLDVAMVPVVNCLLLNVFLQFLKAVDAETVDGEALQERRFPFEEEFIGPSFETRL